MANLASAMTRLDDADREQVDVVFVTTDPARDTRDGAARLPRPVRPRLRRAHRRRSTTIVALGKPLGVAIEKGQKLPSGGYDVDPRHPGRSASTATTRRRSSGPRAPPPPSWPPTSTTLLDEASRDVS